MNVSLDDDLLAPVRYARWLDSPLGQYVLTREQAFFERAVADVFGYYAVQLELPGIDLLATNRMPTRLTAGLSEGCQLACDPAQLPFPAASVDLLILPHTLDFHGDPRSVLREAERVLVPEGRLMLTGFNPWSLWGAARLGKRRRGIPWQAQFLGLPRVKDWMALLGLELESSRVCCYAPPLTHVGWQEKLAFMERAGDRWWPVGGGVYCLEAVKRVRGMRLIAPGWKKARARVRPVAVAVPDRHSPHEQ
ncbi:class I SAM-dependent methyltransferase [Chitinimonas sp.]|uniref:class I SAM-dependent methyltransferase n=1 Tax=Chitinimonas sp. TaxID=1934313 RepID=UPI002F939BD4